MMDNRVDWPQADTVHDADYHARIVAMTEKEWQQFIVGKHRHTWAKERGWRAEDRAAKRKRRKLKSV